ncbi:MAG: 16S rRNA (guanine(527)-N(7))-methyltransferase RsmG [Lachnospiraceae bacterium]
MSKIFEQKLNELGIQLSERQYQQFDDYFELLIEWNKVMNLTGITEYEEVNEKHFVDSLSIVKAIDIGNIETVMDVGTGAGFPGIPLKIAFPHLKVTLLDSLNKRIKFLDTVISDLELEDIHTIHGRAEDYARKEEYRENFDLVVSRAVANLSTLSEYCLPYVKTGGLFIPYKSGEIEEEVKNAETALKILGGKKIKTVKFQLPGSDIGRSLLVIEKIKSTGKKFPRKAGLPAKEPLK